MRGISYGLFGSPGEFGPQARELGAGLVRAYLYWGQIEPEPGRYAWPTVDALLDQLADGSQVQLGAKRHHASPKLVPELSMVSAM